MRLIICLKHYQPLGKLKLPSALTTITMNQLGFICSGSNTFICSFIFTFSRFSVGRAILSILTVFIFRVKQNPTDSAFLFYFSFCYAAFGARMIADKVLIHQIMPPNAFVLSDPSKSKKPASSDGSMGSRVSPKSSMSSRLP